MVVIVIPMFVAVILLGTMISPVARGMEDSYKGKEQDALAEANETELFVETLGKLERENRSKLNGAQMNEIKEQFDELDKEEKSFVNEMLDEIIDDEGIDYTRAKELAEVMYKNLRYSRREPVEPVIEIRKLSESSEDTEDNNMIDDCKNNKCECAGCSEDTNIEYEPTYGIIVFDETTYTPGAVNYGDADYTYAHADSDGIGITNSAASANAESGQVSVGSTSAIFGGETAWATNRVQFTAAELDGYNTLDLSVDATLTHSSATWDSGSSGFAGIEAISFDDDVTYPGDDVTYEDITTICEWFDAEELAKEIVENILTELVPGGEVLELISQAEDLVDFYEFKNEVENCDESKTTSVNFDFFEETGGFLIPGVTYEVGIGVQTTTSAVGIQSACAVSTGVVEEITLTQWVEDYGGGQCPIGPPDCPGCGDPFHPCPTGSGGKLEIESSIDDMISTEHLVEKDNADNIEKYYMPTTLRKEVNELLDTDIAESAILQRVEENWWLITDEEYEGKYWIYEKKER